MVSTLVLANMRNPKYVSYLDVSGFLLRMTQQLLSICAGDQASIELRRSDMSGYANKQHICTEEPSATEI
jgi:hypothetical protein